MRNLFGKTHDFIKMINLLIKTYDCTSMINLLIKANDFTTNAEFLNKQWKGVILGKKVFPLVCSKYLSSWTGLGWSGHDQITTFGQLSHVSGPKLSF